MTTIRLGNTMTTKFSLEADGTDDISIVSKGANVISLTNGGVNILSDTFVVPTGNTVQRPLDASIGEIRFNTDFAKIEGYHGTNWANIQP